MCMENVRLSTAKVKKRESYREFTKVFSEKYLYKRITRDLQENYFYSNSFLRDGKTSLSRWQSCMYRIQKRRDIWSCAESYRLWCSTITWVRRAVFNCASVRKGTLGKMLSIAHTVSPSIIVLLIFGCYLGE